MTGAGVPTLTQVQSWRPWAITDAGREMKLRSADLVELADQMGTQIRDAGTSWDGEAYWAAYDRICGDKDRAIRVAQEVDALGDVMVGCGDSMTNHREVLLAKVDDATDVGFIVSADWNVVRKTGIADDDIDETQSHQDAIASALQSMLTAQSDGVTAIRQAADDVRASGDQFGEGDAVGVAGNSPAMEEFVGGSGRTDPARTEASAAAFEKMFGHRPVSPNDWKTAEALNPNSYDPKYQGVAPEIVVGRIEPVPGQGVVRAALYIPSEEVFNLPDNDLGDNRAEDPNFDPESSRVTVYVDYENGLIITRQNPSVTDAGEVQVGVPSVEAQQLPDGSVMIQYDATNPLAPPGADLTGHNVNGSIVISPESGNPGTPRVVAGGEIGDYPSLEIYQDNSAGDSRAVLIDAADSGSESGPLTNIPFFHEVGGGREMFVPFSADFDDPDWERNRPTSLGSTDNPPSVVVVR